MSQPTLIDLRTMVRQRSNMENNNFVTDAELNTYINASLSRLHTLLVMKFQDYATSVIPTTFTLPGIDGQAIYELPLDFYKLRLLEKQNSNGEWVKCHSIAFGRRSRYNRTNQVTNITNEVVYSVVGDTIQFVPETSGPGNYRLWYVPMYTDLLADLAMVPQWIELNDWYDLAVVDAAIKCLTKQETDSTGLVNEREDIRRQISQAASMRNIGDQPSVIRVGGWRNDEWYRLYGGRT